MSTLPPDNHVVTEDLLVPETPGHEVTSTSCPSWQFLPLQNDPPSSRKHILILRQQPKQSRMCGFGERVDRRPIDPPPIVQLVVQSNNPKEQRTYLHNPYYVMYATLLSDKDNSELHLLKDGKTRSTTGSMISSLFRLKDNHKKEGAYFVFPDLSVRMEGVYKLKFTLFEIIDADIHHCASVTTGPFTKKFPGMRESTALSKAFAEQGLKIRIRKDSVHRRFVTALGTDTSRLNFKRSASSSPDNVTDLKRRSALRHQIQASDDDRSNAQDSNNQPESSKVAEALAYQPSESVNTVGIPAPPVPMHLQQTTQGDSTYVYPVGQSKFWGSPYPPPHSVVYSGHRQVYQPQTSPHQMYPSGAAPIPHTTVNSTSVNQPPAQYMNPNPASNYHMWPYQEAQAYTPKYPDENHQSQVSRHPLQPREDRSFYVHHNTSPHQGVPYNSVPSYHPGVQHNQPSFTSMGSYRPQGPTALNERVPPNMSHEIAASNHRMPYQGYQMYDERHSQYRSVPQGHPQGHYQGHYQHPHQYAQYTHQNTFYHPDLYRKDSVSVYPVTIQQTSPYMPSIYQYPGASHQSIQYPQSASREQLHIDNQRQRYQQMAPAKYPTNGSSGYHTQGSAFEPKFSSAADHQGMLNSAHGTHEAGMKSQPKSQNNQSPSQESDSNGQTLPGMSYIASSIETRKRSDFENQNSRQ